MKLNLDKKVFVITGGAKGIGRAITETIIAEKGVVAVIDLDEELGQQMVKKISNEGGNLLFIQKKLGNSQSCNEAIDQVISHFGKIDGLINNAGVNDGVGLENGTPEKFENSVATNLFHYYHMAHYALPHLKKVKGSILNISSKTALTGQGNTSGYASSKGAQLALTREWAVELLQYGVRVNAIIPAEVLTPQYDHWLKQFDNPEEKRKSIESRVPLYKRMTTPQEIADMAVFLLSERAGHITGQYMHVDGGYVHLDRAID